ncbi:hypothetical protein BDW02DRAFT_495833 [Decorospora gaudefroyi]|uniref:Uncharacterized protein n=1 Tax=Decorospora gaudefroyi TaxID=184978 RepID=A0A6A5KH80_9PLEO|nr:hypothetical protein BDW02DRAFT_495833 [Decorospora gaudefroyi]
MVLEDVDNTAPESFGDEPSSSADDDYASSSSSLDVRFDASNLPRPLPVLGYFMGFSDRAVRLKTEVTLKFAEDKIGRPLRRSESQALAYHLYQLEQWKSYSAALGAAAGTWRWYKTWDKMTYPFYQPKVEDINPNKFAFVRGPMAQFARHTWRFSLYALVAGQLGSAIGQVFAQPMSAKNSAADPKLARFGQELKAVAHGERQRMEQQGREISDKRREFQEQVRNRAGGGPSPQDRWGKQTPVPSEDTGDDMSPTAGDDAWTSDSAGSQSWESFSNDTSQPTPQRQPGPPSTEAWNRQPPPRQSGQQSSLPFDDEASPTGGLFQDEVNNPQTTQAQSQAKPGESSWDRLRRGGGSLPLERPQPHSRRAQPERREQKEDSTRGDSHTFVEGDEERKRERERAQQEFDARLERERQGRDFNSEEGKRW